MKRVCAWCMKEMGAVEGGNRPDTEITHGICESCVDNFTFQQGVPFQRYLDSIPVPRPGGRPLCRGEGGKPEGLRYARQGPAADRTTPGQQRLRVRPCQAAGRVRKDDPLLGVRDPEIGYADL